jgi:phosphatidylserine/phosphatidylglycerophosphate/cardiolipin synthase-like enzyme
MIKGTVGVRTQISFLAPFLFIASLFAMEDPSIAFAAEQLIQIDDSIISEDSAFVDSVFFTQTDGRDSVEAIFTGLIRSEQEKISGALFRLSNKKITAELLEAHRRGIKIEIVFDPGAIGKQILELSKAGIPLFIYNTTKYSSLMHHKLLLFNETLDGRPIVSTGSLNLTEAGLGSNAENVTMRDKKDIFDGFYDEFERLRDNESQRLFHKGCLGLYSKMTQRIKKSKKKKPEEPIIVEKHKSSCFKKNSKAHIKKQKKMKQILLANQTERIVTLIKRSPK